MEFTTSYYMTVKDGTITGIYVSPEEPTAQSVQAIKGESGHEIVLLTEGTYQRYLTGTRAAEYEADGTLRPLLERVLDGLVPIPHDMELIDGALVPKTVTPQEAPVTLRQKLDELTAKNAALETDKVHQAAQIAALTAQTELYADLMQDLIVQVYS